MQTNRLTAAIAHELGCHIDDLVDADPEVLDEDGDPIGAQYLDTTITGDPHSFVVLVGAERRVLVTVRELAAGEAVCGHREYHRGKCAHMGCRNYYTIGSSEEGGDTTMTKQEREAFEARPDFPGWDAL